MNYKNTLKLLATLVVLQTALYGCGKSDQGDNAPAEPPKPTSKAPAKPMQATPAPASPTQFAPSEVDAADAIPAETKPAQSRPAETAEAPAETLSPQEHQKRLDRKRKSSWSW